MFSPSPSWPLTEPTSGQPLPRAATQYPVLRGHIASFFVQFGLKDSQKAYSPYRAPGQLWGSRWSTHPQADP